MKESLQRIQQTILNAVYKAFIRPELYDGWFRAKLIKAAKGEPITIEEIRMFVLESRSVPIGYFIHCLSLDKRFKLDSKKNKVCLAPLPIKTDPHGFIHDDEYLDERTNGHCEYNEPEQDTDYTHFKPFLSEILTKDLQSKQIVFPVVFKNGKFYVDDEPEYQRYHDMSLVSVPRYEAVSMRPLGMSEEITIIDTTCFNCGQKGHECRDCSQPLNRATIRANRLLKDMSNTNRGRFFEELQLINDVSKMQPGMLSKELKTALEMEDGDEPPYYKNMRIHGYPPSYRTKMFLDWYYMRHSQRSV